MIQIHEREQRDFMGEQYALDDYGYWLAEMDADPGDNKRKCSYDAMSQEVV